MARHSKLSTLMQQIITTPLGTAAVHHAAISPQGSGDQEDATSGTYILFRNFCNKSARISGTWCVRNCATVVVQWILKSEADCLDDSTRMSARALGE